SVTPQSLTCVRVACMHMLCGLVMMEDAHEALAAERERLRAQEEAKAAQAETEGAAKQGAAGAEPMQVDGAQATPEQQGQHKAPAQPQPPAAAAAAAAAGADGATTAPNALSQSPSAAASTPGASETKAATASASAPPPTAAPAAAAGTAAGGEEAQPAGSKPEHARVSSVSEKKAGAAHEGELSEGLRGKLATMFFK
ncbi:hypothetical protein DUNSADRAFT_7599, partial [Dunaliella salina]